MQTDRIDKSAVGWDHIEKVEKHESQKDYSKGFGGKFGVQSDRQDKSAVGWDHHEQPNKHESQTDHKIGFGGKFGLQTDRVDKSAVGNFNEMPSKVGTNYTKVKPDIGDAKPGDLRARFETMNAGEARGSRVAVPQKPKQLDQSKTAFLTQGNAISGSVENVGRPRQLDQAKLAQFNSSNGGDVVVEKKTGDKVREEIEQLKEEEAKKEEIETVVEKETIKEPLYVNNEEMEKRAASVEPETVPQQVTVAENEDFYAQEEIVDTGITATALYDYQAAAEDEVSFDPDDLITHIEQVD